MAQRFPTSGYILALDIGDKRIGVAVASAIARLPRPLDMLPAEEDAVSKIVSIAEAQEAELIVIGIPRNLQGEETAQSQSIREFAAQLGESTKIPIVFADESLSSVRADNIAKYSAFKNASSDSLAACFILEEYFITSATAGNMEEL